MVVYVPTPPVATANAAKPEEKPQYVVIEQPLPPEPEPETDEAPTPPPTGTNTVHHHRAPSHPTAPAEPEQPAPEEATTPPPAQAEVPTLEPRQSSAQETQARDQYLKLAQDIRERLGRLNGRHLSGGDRRTLEDARTFFAQSSHALASGDVARALNLARKASLLISALE